MTQHHDQNLLQWAGPSASPTASALPIPAGLTAGAATVLVLVTPVLAWLALGNEAATGFAPSELSYVARAPEISTAAQWSAGVGGAAVALVALRVLHCAGRPAAPPRRRLWWLLLGPFLAAGVFAAMLGRTMTAGGIGANIGYGVMVMATPVVLGGLGLLALVACVQLFRGRADVPGGRSR